MVFDGDFCKTNQRLTPITFFRKKLHLRCLAGFSIRRIKFDLSSGKSAENYTGVVRTLSNIYDGFFDHK